VSQLALGGLGGIVLAPDTLEEQRGAWCSPPEYTAAAGPFDLDPFTNPRSTLVADYTCMLERGDDGFGLELRHIPGAFYVNGAGGGLPPLHDIGVPPGHCIADESWSVWIQPDYAFVLEAIAHYGHTRFTALLRLDTSTKWYDQLWNMCEVIMVPKRDRLEFVPPPGVKASSNPFPHGLYYKRAAGVTDAIKALCYPWPCPLYPYKTDPLQLVRDLYFTTAP
jgi:hypothetical protein